MVLIENSGKVRVQDVVLGQFKLRLFSLEWAVSAKTVRKQ
jgi:hypothetical protein